ncbi:MAG TPA: UDP-N-acetylmuramate dehydrogenase, partial [Chloroflexota bacterium]|nr:UDP-N-acetylmuramate dehydrogenase [Chloroflexota bacterium]
FTQDHGIERVLFLGHGANLLFPDEYFDGAIVRLVDGDQPLSPIDVSPTDGNGTGEHVLVESYAGETLDRLIQRSFAAGLVGLEWAGGLPGTVGAAVRGNVGAFGGEIKDVVHQVDVLDTNQEIPRVRSLEPEELNFAYRDSLIKRDCGLVALNATFRLKHGDPEDISRARQVYHDNIAYRESHHPLDYPNTGSTFKNVARAGDVAKVLAVFPDLAPRVAGEWHGKVSMGYLNRRLGFSGYRIGNAAVADKHCNFILNLGGAQARDVRAIIDDIRRRFDETFHFQPEPEIEIIGQEPASTGAPRSS